MTTTDLLSVLLRPAGGGVHLVSTGKEAQRELRVVEEFITASFDELSQRTRQMPLGPQFLSVRSVAGDGYGGRQIGRPFRYQFA